MKEYYSYDEVVKFIKMLEDLKLWYPNSRDERMFQRCKERFLNQE